MGNVLFIFTHRAHACERACATERVVKHSLIYGPTLFKFAANILQITTSNMGYVMFMITHRAHACECARACERLVKHSLIFGRILFNFAGLILQMTTSYMGYTLIFTHRGHTRARARA
jgi:hypothetical protein